MSDTRNPGGDATGLLQSIRQGSSAGPSLVDASVVEGLVREFLGRVFGRIAAVGEGKVTTKLAASADEADCRYMAGFFSGRIAGYSVQPDWNPVGLARSLRIAFPESIDASAPDEEAIAQLFALATHHVYEMVKSGGEDQERAIDALVRGTVLLLLGVRQS